jgi:hypothetical protein
VRSFQSRTERVERTGKLRIEAPAGEANVSMGYGVFTGAGIRSQDHSYSFELENVGVVDAREYGNVCEFSPCPARPLQRFRNLRR